MLTMDWCHCGWENGKAVNTFDSVSVELVNKDVGLESQQYNTMLRLEAI